MTSLRRFISKENALCNFLRLDAGLVAAMVLLLSVGMACLLLKVVSHEEEKKTTSRG